MKKALMVFCTVLVAFYFISADAYAQQADLKAKVKALKPADFPGREIEFTVAFAAGGGMDVTARILAKHLEKYIDTRVIVVNKTGGGGLIGHASFAKEAKKDGHSVAIYSNSYWTFALTNKEYPIDAIEPLAYITMEPSCTLVTTKGPFKNMSIKEILDHAKKNPKTVKVYINPGQSGEFTMKKIEKAAGVQFIKVPFQGGKQATIALLGGHIDLCNLYYTEFAPQLDAGEVKVVAVASDERYSLFPKIPTFNEILGVDYIQKPAWRFACVPKGVKPDRFRYLEAAIDAVLHDQNCIEDFRKLKLVIGEKYMNGAQVKKAMAALAKDDEEDLKAAGLLK